MSLVSTNQARLSLPSARRLGPLLLAPLLTAALLAAVLAGWKWLSAPEQFPLTTVRLDGRLEKVAEDELREAISPHLDKGMLGLDIARVRAAVEALPWVAEAAVRRQWPDTLLIGARERVAAAHWNGSLMDTDGEVFQPRQASIPPDLPVLQGPPESLPQVWARFQRLSAAFGQVGLEIKLLRMDERRAWTAELADGVVIKLGIDDTDAAVERFVRALPRIGAAEEAQLVRVDLRYPNGFALAWSSATPQSPRKK